MGVLQGRLQDDAASYSLAWLPYPCDPNNGEVPPVWAVSTSDATPSISPAIPSLSPLFFNIRYQFTFATITPLSRQTDELLRQVYKISRSPDDPHGTSQSPNL